MELGELTDDVRAKRMKITSYLAAQPKDNLSWLKNMTESVRSEYVLRVYTRESSRRWLVMNSLSHGNIAKLAYEGQTEVFFF